MASPLFICCVETEELSGEAKPQSWGVSVTIDGQDYSVLHGFGRKVDAEIAKKWIEELEIDWNVSADQLARQCKAAGYRNRRAMMKKVCERLQW